MHLGEYSHALASLLPRILLLPVLWSQMAGQVVLKDNLRSNLTIDLVAPSQKQLVLPFQILVRECIQSVESIFHILHGVVKPVGIDGIT